MDETKEDTKTGDTAQAVGFPCKNCGSQMSYDPARGTLYCPYCKSTEEIVSVEEEAPEYAYFPEEDAYDAPKWEERGRVTLTCPSCGAETLMSAAAMTATCPFCGANYVTEPQEGKEVIQPETMIPFRVSEGDARSAFAKWVRRRFFAPRRFKRGTYRPQLNGIYVPYWTFDAAVHTDYDGFGGRQRVEHYTVRVNGKTEQRTRTKTDWYPVHGSMELDFDNIPCPATKKLDRQLLDKVSGSYSLRTLNVYNPAFLAGFFAERYSVGLGEGFAAVRKVMESRMEAHIRSSLGYDTYRGMSYRHHFRNVKFKHILLPLWLASYRYHEKIFHFMVNGETGQIAGKAPLSPWKIAGTVLLGIAAAVLFGYFLYAIGDMA